MDCRRAVTLMPLVLAVLAGLVGMHGLGPVAATQPRPPMSIAAHMAVPMAVHAAHGDTEQASPGCHHHGGEGSLDHADATCAATGVASGPVLSLPAAFGTVTLPGRTVVRAYQATAVGRAPPSLSRLQLLRI
ncbi:MAG TPA: DUF6153 family protein [Thermomonospora sp.]|nr:DUF6153 family protein [Thermomonospora sp.]